MSVQRSIVKWFDAKKGYGFIVHPDGGGDIFVHYSAISSEQRFKTLRTGEEVEFELGDGPKGLHAHKVVGLGLDDDDSSMVEDDASHGRDVSLHRPYPPPLSS